MKLTYDKYCFVGTIFKGNTPASAKITKIVITESKAYVCYKASDLHVSEVTIENRKSTIKLKPIKSNKFALNSFLSAIKNGTVNVISTPNNKLKCQK